MSARIYSPAKTAMQSGKAKTGHWILDFDPEQPRKIDPLMGYTTSGDMKSQIRLTFETKEARHRIPRPRTEGRQAPADFLRGEFPL
jgi:hypothetical protein